MKNQSELFYKKEYESLLKDFDPKSRDPQTIHNLSVVRYLKNGDCPLDLFDIAEKIIYEQAMIVDGWALHPSWALIQYNKCLYFFDTCKYVEMERILSEIWRNSVYINKFTLVCVSLLTYELAIRVGMRSNLEKAKEFFGKEFEKLDNLSSFLANENVNQCVADNLVEKYKFMSKRLEIEQLIRNHNKDKSKTEVLKKILIKFEGSPGFNSQKPISIYRILHLFHIALFLDDSNKFNILNGKTDQNNPIILNNIALNEIIQKKYSSALLLLSKGLSIHSKDTIVYPYQKIIYNIGISFLLRGKPRKAFRYFYSLLDILHDFPYLWVRLAECCVLFFKLKVAKIRGAKQMSDLIARRLSTPTRTYTILPISDSKLFARFGRLSEGIESNLTLEFGERCVRNALNLCNESQLSLKINATLLWEYITLEIGDYNQTIEINKSIVSNNNSIDPNIKFLSRIYASQASYMLGDYNNAFVLLKPNLLEVTLNKEIGVMLYQTACRVSLSINESDKSQNFLNKAIENNPNSREVLLTKVAHELQNKRTVQALAILDPK